MKLIDLNFLSDSWRKKLCFCPIKLLRDSNWFCSRI